jgi:1-acyl-sn-glycerol-3-phosphate acyltransferase
VRRDRVYRVVNWAVLLAFRALGLRFDVRGAGNIPERGAAVLACNHLSYLDFTFVGLAARER